MSLTYIVVALLAVILNNVLVERLSMHTRITVGTSALRLHTQTFHIFLFFFKNVSAIKNCVLVSVS